MQESYRDRFVVDDPELVYLDGNSLGRLPKATIEILRQLVEEQWGKSLIRGWNEGWLNLPQRLGDKIGVVIGANPGETIVCDSTSVNLFKLAWAMFHATSNRNKIVSDSANFPSDLHILSGVVEQSTCSAELVTLDLDDLDPEQTLAQLSQVVDDQTAFVSLSHVQFKSGRLFDLAKVTDLVHAHGSKIIWDLSHSVGAVPINLANAKVDAAVGCTYKFLNGGPGAPAFLYVRRELIDQLDNPIQGWFGTQNPFAFSTQFQPHAAIDRFAVGTPPVISMAAIEPGLDLVLEAGIRRLRNHSLQLSEQLIEAFDKHLSKLGYSLLTPRDPDCRGSHISFGHPMGWQITQDLIANHAIIPDFREPNVIRLGIAPLYNTLEEIEVAIQALIDSVQLKTYESFSAERTGVT